MTYKHTPGANTGFEFGWHKVVTRFRQQGYKDFLNCLIPAPTMVGGEENLWFLDALKCSKMLHFKVHFAWKDLDEDKNCLLWNFKFLHIFQKFGHGGHNVK